MCADVCWVGGGRCSLIVDEDPIVDKDPSLIMLLVVCMGP